MTAFLIRQLIFLDLIVTPEKQEQIMEIVENAEPESLPDQIIPWVSLVLIVVAITVIIWVAVQNKKK